MKTIVKISGMSCGHCVKGVQSALKDLPGITSFAVEIGEAVIDSGDGLDLDQVRQAIEEEGYEVISVS
jgi:copper chaperone